MNLFSKLTAAAIVIISVVSSVSAAEYTKGVVKKLDEKANKVTIQHQELKNLEMPAMTMVFVVKDPTMLSKLKIGQNIEFVAERLNGKLTLTELK
jgi:Cu/Ag efflux protein CusF